MRAERRLVARRIRERVLPRANESPAAAVARRIRPLAHGRGGCVPPPRPAWGPAGRERPQRRVGATLALQRPAGSRSLVSGRAVAVRRGAWRGRGCPSRPYPRAEFRGPPWGHCGRFPGVPGAVLARGGRAWPGRPQRAACPPACPRCPSHLPAVGPACRKRAR